MKEWIYNYIINTVRYNLTYSLLTRGDFEGMGIVVEDTVFQKNGTRYNLAPVGEVKS